MKKRLRITLITILFVIIAMVSGFLLYVSDYYRAEPIAIEVTNNTRIKTQGNLIILSPENPRDTALIFYPGGKVEPTAYLPILQKISLRADITCILVKMPFNLAVFKPDAAEDIIHEFPDIKNWYVGGHSLGGAMASDYASKNPEKIKGLILLGAYLYGDYPAEKALTVYGELDVNAAEKIDYSENVLKINGGNHAQFGNYGKQKGDPDAAISSDEQQDIATEAIIGFMN